MSRGWNNASWSKNLHSHQYEAAEHLERYLQAKTTGAALVRMPTGTGKTGIIAIAAQCFATVGTALVVTPWAALRRQMIADLRDGFWGVVGAPPPRKPVESFAPASFDLDAHHDCVYVGTIQALQLAYAEYPKVYNRLRSRLDLIIVDEGHREPAPQWARAVRELGVRTALFTATPYRNDWKLFNVDRDHIYRLTHHDAVGRNIIRGVRFFGRRFSGDANKFVKSLLAFYRSPDFQPPTMPKRDDVPRVIVRCETQSDVTELTALLVAEGVKAIGIHDRYADEEHDENHAHRVPDPKSTDADFWVHQFKLMEGLDDPRFALLAVYQPFRNGRSFVQQVGRIIRNPGQKKGQWGSVLIETDSGQEAYWQGYLQFERNYEKDPDHVDQRQAFEVIVRSQAELLYVHGQYRQRFEVDSFSPSEDLALPLSANVLRPSSRIDLSRLLKALEEQWREDDVDVRKTLWHGDTVVLLHVTYRNSPLLAKRALTEYSLGCTLLRKRHGLLFFYDSNDKRSEAVLDAARPADPRELERLFSAEDARLTQVTLRNSDLGAHSVRRRSLQAFSMADTAPGLADHSHFCSLAYGYTRTAGGDGRRRYVGFGRARVSDPAAGSHNLDQWIEWTDGLAKVLLDERVVPPAVFERFAQKVAAPEQELAAPRNILFDVTDVEDAFRRAGQAGPEALLRIDDLCASVTSGIAKVWANRTNYEVAVKYDPERERYTLECSDLEKDFVSVDNVASGRRDNLVAYLNREQAFRIVPEANGLIYARRHFYRPRAALTGRKADVELARVLESINDLDVLETEKGDASASANGKTWHPTSVFGWLDGGAKGTPLSEWLDGADILVCDDMQTEAADFILGDSKRHRVAFIHAKAQRERSYVSAKKLAQVTAQAVKNLDYLNMFSMKDPPNVGIWSGDWKEPSIGKVKGRIRRGAKSGPKIWSMLKRLIQDPQTERQVWIVCARSLSAGEFAKEAHKSNPSAEAIQVLYSIQSTWSAVASIGARLRLFCSK
jgi:superfamily II DNA or RNA helicase